MRDAAASEWSAGREELVHDAGREAGLGRDRVVLARAITAPVRASTATSTSRSGRSSPLARRGGARTASPPGGAPPRAPCTGPPAAGTAPPRRAAARSAARSGGRRRWPPHLEHRDQVVADRLAARLRQRPLERGERRDQQVLLAGPAPVQRRLADPGPRRDVLAAHAVDAALADRLDGGLEERLLGLLTARTPRAPGGGAVTGGVPAARCYPGVRGQPGRTGSRRPRQRRWAPDGLAS